MQILHIGYIQVTISTHIKLILLYHLFSSCGVKGGMDLKSDHSTSKYHQSLIYQMKNHTKELYRKSPPLLQQEVGCILFENVFENILNHNEQSK
jgi:hypothetical protein